MRRFVLGTAGHVDHGKTTLVRALTGVETDRLPEEQARGISIELGYAPLPLRPEILACVVDMPGHEKLVRTMVSGASGIEAVLLVVAADEGIRPQTVEHLEICHLLGIEHAIVALTKTDLVDTSTIRIRAEEARIFLRDGPFRNAPVVPVSVPEARGLNELRQELLSLAFRLPERTPQRVFKLPIDRVFSMAGHGTIVTGTQSGDGIRRGDRVTVIPDGGEFVVRGLQVFKETLEEVTGSSRVALNLTGIHREQLARGQVVCRMGEILPTRHLHASLRWTLPEGAKIPVRGLKLLVGTQDLTVALRPAGKSARPEFGEFHSREPMVVRSGDRFVLRTSSPPKTIGGGEVLDPMPSRPADPAMLARLASASLEERVMVFLAHEPRSLEFEGLSVRASVPVATVAEVVDRLVAAHLARRIGPERAVANGAFDTFARGMKEAILAKGEISLAEWMGQRSFAHDPKLAQAVFQELLKKGEVLFEQGRVRPLNLVPAERPRCLERIENGGLEPPTLTDLAQESGESRELLRRACAVAAREGLFVRLSEDLYCSRAAVDGALQKARDLFASSPTITIAQWKEAIGLSRKYAVPWLEYLDRERFTLCRPDHTRLRGPRL